MDSDGIESEDPEGMVEIDIRHLTKILTPDDLDPALMFAKKRGIRSCTPSFDAAPGEGEKVADRLKRVPPPESQD
jgi:hypothetical protein